MAQGKKRNPRKRHIQTGTVTISIIAPMIGGIGLILFMIPTILCLIQAEWGTAAVFGAFDLLCIALLLTVNWRIDYNHEGFTYRNYFRISRHYTYDQITAVRRDKDSVIRIGHKRIRIDQMADHGEQFLNVVSRHAYNARYKAAKDAKLFRGNVRNPKEFIVLWGIMGAMIVGFGVIVIHGSPLLKLEELNFAETVLSGLEERYDEGNTPILKLVQDKENYYILYRYDEVLTDYEGLKAEVEAGKPFRIYYEASETEDYVHYYVRQLECGETIYYSLAQHNKETYQVWALVGGVVVLWALFVAVSWYVMSHADKYPRLVKLFVKPEYLVK